MKILARTFQPSFTIKISMILMGSLFIFSGAMTIGVIIKDAILDAFLVLPLMMACGLSLIGFGVYCINCALLLTKRY